MGVNPVGGAWTPSSYGGGATGSGYPLNIDAMLANLQRMGQAFNPHQTATPAMTVTLDPGFIFAGTTLSEIALQTTGTITAPVSNPRIDRIVIDASSGAVSVITGTPAGSPTAPAITAGKLPVAQVLLQTSSTSITNSMITDERALWSGAGVSSLADATNGGISLSASSGAVTVSLNVNDLTTKASPALADLLALYDVAGSASKKSTLTSVQALIAPAGNFTTEATITAASTTNLGSLASNAAVITGNTGITSFGNSASTANPFYFIRFTGTPTITNSATMICRGASNVIVAAGDNAIVKFEGSSTWRFINYFDSEGHEKPWSNNTTIGTNDGTHAISSLTLYADGRVKAYTNVTGLSGSGGGGGTCFPWFALVEMEGGSFKRIVELRIGDRVVGAYGEINTITALDPTTLGLRMMFRINGEHDTSDEHSHMRPDRTFVAPNPNSTYSEFGKAHPTVQKDGLIRPQMFVGLPEGLVTQMRVGQELLTATGPKLIKTLEICDVTEYPPDTLLFGPIADGSGTCRINGYVVSARFDKDKFDHVEWKPKT